MFGLFSLQKNPQYNLFERVVPLRTGSNRTIMKNALQATVIPALKSKGFGGSYPHFRKDCADHIELISFWTNKYGGSFTVEFSAVFPDCRDKNLVFDETLQDPELNAAFANETYRLPGMFDGWFYYTDVYQKRTLRFGNLYFTPEGETQAGPDASQGWRLVQRFDAEAASDICNEVEKQMADAFIWLAKFVRKRLSKP